MKKYAKLFVFTLFAFFTSSLSVFAREMTVEELGKEVDAVVPTAGYVYILGEYAFTSNYTITSPVMILAGTSLSIDKSKPTDISQIVIYQIERLRNEDFEAIGWKKGDNALGTKTMPDKVDVKYIDMKYHILEKSKANVNIDLTDGKFSKYTGILEENLKFKANEAYEDGKLTYNSENGKLSGLLLKDNNITLSTEDKTKYQDPIYFFAYVLEVPGATVETKITTSGMGREGTIEWSSFDETSSTDGNTPAVSVLVPIILDKWKEDPTYTITIDLDGDKDEETDVYGKTTYKLDLRDLTFQETSVVSINDTESDISEEDKTTLKDWGYTLFGNNKHYTLEKDTEKGDNAYKLTGKIEKQFLKENTFNTNEEDAYFFVFNLKKPEELEEVPEGVKVTVTGEKTFTYGIKSFNDSGVFTEIFKLKDSCDGDASCKITIKVDWDGNGQKYLESEEITIDYSSVTLIKSSEVSILSVKEGGLSTNPLEENYGWTEPDNFDVKIKMDGTNVNVSGLLPILDNLGDKHPFGEEDTTGYYLPFVIQTKTGNKNDNANLTIVFMHEGEESKTITANDFDETDKLYILRHLHKDAEDKTFKIIVDMDGAGEEYSPYELTFDWSELKLQEKTVPSVDLTSASTKDKEQLNSWGYNSTANTGMKITSSENDTYTLEGKLTEQVLNNDVFKDSDGYYFDFTFKLPKDVDMSKVKISHLTKGELNGDGNIKKTFKESAYDKENKTLTILYQFTEDPKCSENTGNCKIYYSVDYDGAENQYLPTLVTIDYSKFTFEKSSVFTISELSLEDEDKYPNQGWYDKEKGYEVKVETTEEAHKYKVSGVLPFLEDEDWEEGDTPEFTSSSQLYYLGLGLKLVNAPADYDKQEGNTTINIIFDHDAESNSFIKLFGSDFSESKMLYLLKALRTSNEDGSPIQDTDKWFKITVDLDGDGEEYAPYEVIIDYSELKFQTDSFDNVTFDLIDESSLEEGSSAKKELEGYKFNPDTVKGVTIEKGESQEDREQSNVGITGSIKEQTLENAFNNNTGYFVPIKISLPIDEEWYQEYKDKWTITLYNEDGSKKVYEPNEEERKQGWVLVLFKVSSDKEEIKYELDFDGEEFAFLPFEYTIKNDITNYQTENKITFEYFDETSGKVVSKDEIVYEGETIDTDKIPQFEDKNYSYHTFDYWYDTSKGEVNEYNLETQTTGKNEDITLKAHWTIDVDKFLASVVDDLADIESEITDNYSDIFEISKSGNTITFKILDSDTKLSKLNETSIPGTIAYILQRGEIKDITLASGGKTVKFTKEGEFQVQTVSLDAEGNTLKEKIQKGAKDLFTELLGSGNEENMTLNQMAVEDRDFTLTIGSLDNSVKLPEGANATYTFDFKTDTAPITTKEGLETALKNPEVSHIDITQELTLESQIDIERSVTIDGKNSTITSSVSDSPIFNVKSTGVTIENMTISNAKATPISVESGDLTIKNITLTGEEETLDAGIEVKDGATLTASEMTYDSEHYNKPLVKAAKTATVNLTDKNSQKATPITKENITKYSAQDEGQKQNSYGDIKAVDSSYDYLNYYNDSNNSKIYQTKFYNYEGRRLVNFTSYNYYNEDVTLPPEDTFKEFYELTYDGNKYELIGFTESRDNTLHDGSKDKDYSTTLPEGVVKKESLKATEDKTYYSAYKVSLPDNVTKVKDAQSLKEALENPSISEIYIDTTELIDMTSSEMQEITISRKLSIIGKPAISKLKLKNIKITADDVFLSRLNIDFTDGTNNNNALIDISEAAQDVAIWQCTFTNSGSAVDYAVQYKGNTKSIVDVRWTTFGVKEGDNKFNKGYIYVGNELATGSNISANTFNKLANNEDGKKSAITINKFSSTDVEVDDDNIKIDGNTYRNGGYDIMLEKTASGTKANVSIVVSSSSSEVKMAVHYGENAKDFGGVSLDADIHKVKVSYIDESGNVSDRPPEGVTGVTFKAEITME